MGRLPRWSAAAIALVTLVAIHGWSVAFLLSGGMPLQGALSVQQAVFASLREIPSTAVLFLPAWLPILVPSKMIRLSRWVAVICGAVSLAVAISLGIVVALRQEWFFVAAAGLYAVIGLLNIADRRSHVPSVVASQHNGT